MDQMTTAVLTKCLEVGMGVPEFLLSLVVVLLMVSDRIHGKKQTATQRGVKALLRDRIISTYNHYIDQGYFPIYARENVRDLHAEYKALGGNGVADKLVQDLMNLPTEKKEV